MSVEYPLYLQNDAFSILWICCRSNLCKVIMQGKLFHRWTHLLYCSVLSLGGNINTRRMGSIFHIKNQWNILVYRKLLCELSKVSKLNAFNNLRYYTNTDASILVYKFRPERTGFNVYAEYTRPQLTFLALHPWHDLSR